MAVNYGVFPETIMKEMQSDNPRVFMAIETLYSTPLRCHTGVGTYIIEGNEYVGVGQLGAIDPIEQKTATEPGKVRQSISGLDPTLVAETLNERSQGKPSRIMICSYGDDYQITAVAEIFIGEVSTQSLEYGKTMSVMVEVVDAFIMFSRTGSRRFDDVSHQIEHPGDEFFSLTGVTSEIPIYWGSKKDGPSIRHSKS